MNETVEILIKTTMKNHLIVFVNVKIKNSANILSVEELQCLTRTFSRVTVILSIDAKKK